MERKLTISLAVVLVCAMAAWAWVCFGPHEPAYQGKGLSVWLEERTQTSQPGRESPDRAHQAFMAIQQIGTNALPTLLRMAGAKDSALKTKLIALVGRQSFVKLPLRPAGFFHARATYGFSALGPAAKPAVPALIEMLRDQDPQVRASAAHCLSLIGPDAREAVPALLRALADEGNGYGPVLMDTMGALGQIRSEPEVVVPVLISYISGPRPAWNYCTPAMDALGRYREQAKSAVPFLLPFLDDPDGSRRFAADAALNGIDPQAATQAAQARGK